MVGNCSWQEEFIAPVDCHVFMWFVMAGIRTEADVSIHAPFQPSDGVTYKVL